MAQVVLERIHKTYAGEKGREVAAVENASLTIEDQEFMVFVGPSGCGKSTTLRMIAGLEEITSGTIYIDGQRMNDVAPKDRDIAMVFQNYALYPHMTVYKNMAFGLQLRRYPKSEIDARVREAAQILGLSPDMLERRPKALSGGQRQRVALGRAIVRKPKVFLFDEPLSNLDAKMRVQMRTEISKLHERLATTMIYVTHDQVEAMTMGDRICLMKDGRIQQVAPPLEIYNAPANMYVAAFIGSPPMNFFPGKLVAADGALFFCGGDPGGTGYFRLRVADSHGAKLRSLLDQPLHLGLRPESLEVRPATGATSAFRADVDLVEAMGQETLFYLKCGGCSFIARVAGQVHEPTGDIADVVAHMEHAHYFEAADPAAFKQERGTLDLEKWQAACRRIL